MTGDELVTDAFSLSVVDDFFYEVDGVMITEGGEEIDIGGNAAEGEEEEGSDSVKVCNVVSSGRFQETQFGKKDYVAMYKAYIKVRCRPRPPLRPAACASAEPASFPVVSPGLTESRQAPEGDQPGPRRRLQGGECCAAPACFSAPDSAGQAARARTRVQPLNSARACHDSTGRPDCHQENRWHVG